MSGRSTPNIYGFCIPKSDKLLSAQRIPARNAVVSPVFRLTVRVSTSNNLYDQRGQRDWMKDLKGKVAFIAGGTTGIGLGIARALQRAGMHVAIASRNNAHLDDAIAQLSGPGNGVYPLQVDVTDRDGMAAAADEVERAFGKVHILCNNAGVGIMVPVSRATYNDWDWAVGVNIMGVVNGVRAFLPKILAHGEGGHIVSTSSMSGLFLGANAGVYSTTKYAVVGMMESLRADLESANVGVSVYCPGLVNTNFHESEAGRPAKFAEAGRELSAEAKARVKATILSNGMDPIEAGERVLRGILRNDLYILTHPEYTVGLRERFEAVLASMPDDDPPPQRVAAERSVSILSHPIYATERDRLLAERHQRRTTP
jgi:NAD(P)-dependent dehydrogenase (short-subunit alcohol dehydrogenase family)